MIPWQTLASRKVISCNSPTLFSNFLTFVDGKVSISYCFLEQIFLNSSWLICRVYSAEGNLNPGIASPPWFDGALAYYKWLQLWVRHASMFPNVLFTIIHLFPCSACRRMRSTQLWPVWLSHVCEASRPSYHFYFLNLFYFQEDYRSAANPTRLSYKNMFFSKHYHT